MGNDMRERRIEFKIALRMRGPEEAIPGIARPEIPARLTKILDGRTCGAQNRYRK
jgi:hypothetical protein